jgi:ankyrin repeat protein
MIKLQTGMTALHEATTQGHLEVVKYLLSKGSFIDAQTAVRSQHLCTNI